MVIHELKNPIQVHTKHGVGNALIIIDYGLNVNSVWLVRLKGGHVKHYYSDDIRIYDNPMNGVGFDLDIPNDWKK